MLLCSQEQILPPTQLSPLEKEELQMDFFSLLLREVECLGDEASAMYDLGISDF